jgi:hypothetical protein
VAIDEVNSLNDRWLQNKNTATDMTKIKVNGYQGGYQI